MENHICFTVTKHCKSPCSIVMLNKNTINNNFNSNVELIQITRGYLPPCSMDFSSDPSMTPHDLAFSGAKAALEEEDGVAALGKTRFLRAKDGEYHVAHGVCLFPYQKLFWLGYVSKVCIYSGWGMFMLVPWKM